MVASIGKIGKWPCRWLPLVLRRDYGGRRLPRRGWGAVLLKRQHDADTRARSTFRTGTGTLSVFAPRPLKFRLSAGNDAPDRGQGQHRLILPLLTTKRVYTRAVIAELLWFISGATSSKSLSAQGVRIWDDNGSRGFLDSVGLSHRDEGDLGPVYGFQWRHFGAEYVDAETDYTGRGVDQLAEVIDKLRNRPYDRRILLSAWNPADLKKMALPPCHLLAQFYVSFPGAARGRDAAAAAAAAAAASPTDARGKGVLHCQLYQRSCDIGLGVPFNIASYALLTHMLAHVTDLVPGTFTMVMGDAHVYLDHLSALEEQIGREPRPFPELIIKRARPAHTDEQPGHGTPNAATDIDGWTSDDFEIRGYEPHKAISMKMSV